jgi:hypothetical protein
VIEITKIMLFVLSPHQFHGKLFISNDAKDFNNHYLAPKNIILGIIEKNAKLP